MDINCQFNIYDTDQRFVPNSLQYDCLTYYIYREKLAYQELSDVIDESIPYCFRPEDESKRSTQVAVGPYSTILNFEQARISGITVLQLLSWSVPMETIEKYQFYLNEPNTAVNEQFYNCTPPWFGLYCQYSFEFGENMSFSEIAEHQFLGRAAYIKSRDIIVKVPCYVLLECHRAGQEWCLDWREICDGKVDCLDEGLDEENCSYMETNKCNTDEYQCHNGLCISEDLWEDGLGETECLDRSDSDIDFSFINSCYQDPSFRCEEHSCRAHYNSFACGDGQCVYLFNECHNGRHELLVDSFAMQGNLTDECWIAMVCLTGFDKKCDEVLPKLWSISNKTLNESLEQCESFFSFPTIPVHSNHIYLMFNNSSLNFTFGTPLLPDYVCYNQQLCDSIQSYFTYENQTCINSSSVLKFQDFVQNPWVELVSSIKLYFYSSCINFPNMNKNTMNLINNSLSYQCQNSSKFIPIRRIMDGFVDCPGEEDELYENSCQLNDRFRIKCIDETKCWSPLAKSSVCLLNGYEINAQISFETFCDGIALYYYDNNGQEYSDESGCSDWSCDNMYTRCDGYWTCPDGRDESKCGQGICPTHTCACISPDNFSISCLPFDLVNNEIVDCLGDLNKQIKCRAAQFSKQTSYPFYCSEEEDCLELSQLCDGRNDCEEGSDETFCRNQPLICDYNSMYKYTDAEKVICDLKEIETRQVKYTSVYTSSKYPSTEKTVVGEFNHWPKERRLTQNRIIQQNKNHSFPWLCNRGLTVRTLTNNNSIQPTCLCPPSYYGTLCQYQSQRVSITLKLSSNERSATYAIVIMLIEDNDEQQIEAIRIDTFEKNSLSYTGSWHQSISFLYLPINRLGFSLNLSNHHLLASSFDHSTTCNNGQYTKYFNGNTSFCRCFPGWGGRQCNISVKCQGCSPDSLCIGSVKNRSVCVCPIDKFGRRCLFTTTCPSNACQNNGKCVPADISILGNNFTCLCPVQFFGQFCQYRKAQLDISLDGIPAPPYIVAHFFSLSNTSDPIETIILRKFTLFQLSVSFHIAIPFQLVFVKLDQSYYLAALQQTPKAYISTSISPAQRCESTDQLLNSTVLNMIPYQRILYFHLLCQTNFQLSCFVDKAYLCLCTNDHHANCLPFNSNRHFQRSLNNICQNQGRCLQDHRTCPSIKICLCPDCFFGDHCQYCAKTVGTTLDEILGYEIKSNTKLSEQPFAVKFTAAVTTIMFVVGIINSVICILVFSRKASREVGCGIYLLASSVTSMIIIVLYTTKFWFLFASYQNFSGQKYIREGNCYAIEPLLQLFLYYENWLNAFVALERTSAVVMGVKFNKKRSRITAIILILISPVIIGCLLVPQITRLYLFDDEIEERTWCVVTYVGWIESYRIAFIHIHYFGPLVINIISMILIVTLTAYQKHLSHNKERYMTHVRSQMEKNKHVLISTITVVVLTLPYLITSSLLECKKSSRIFWLSLATYFLSFFPATLIFLIYAFPSPLYKKQFDALVKRIRKHLQRRR